MSKVNAQFKLDLIDHLKINCSICNKSDPQHNHSCHYWFIKSNGLQIHPECFKKILRDRISFNHQCRARSRYKSYFPSSSSELRGFDNIKNSDTKSYIVNLLWPNQLSSKQAMQENLTKPINNLSASELRIELEKRNIPHYVELYPEKDEAFYHSTYTQMLINFYDNSSDCKEIFNMLVYGYVKNYECIYILNVPSYLTQLILLFFPSIVFD